MFLAALLFLIRTPALDDSDIQILKTYVLIQDLIDNGR